jgi:hypothetical protein
MKVTDDTRDIEERARALFDGSVERIDGATRSRLTQARHAALAELDRPRFRIGSWLPVGALAAAAMLAVMLWTHPGPTGETVPVLAAAPADDFELLTLGPDLDMLGEDVEFYAWAASAAMANGQG